jgi:FdhE protein
VTSGAPEVGRAIPTLHTNAPTFDGLAREHPEWRGWLDVMRAALNQAADPVWSRVVVTPGSDPRAPWLTGACVEMSERLARRWLRDLMALALRAPADGPGTPTRAPRGGGSLDAAGFLRAAVELDLDALDAVGAAAGIDGGLARALAHPVALPVLAACAARAGTRAGWDRGYCPVCGAWPALAELRGLEASRQLRCARCGADWATAWLTCVFCGNDDHRELAGLVSEAAGAMRRVDTCTRCRGYLKSVTTLTARSHAEVVIEDMATVPYDVSALGEGACRPAGLATPLGVDLRLTGGTGLFGWRR